MLRTGWSKLFNIEFLRFQRIESRSRGLAVVNVAGLWLIRSPESHLQNHLEIVRPHPHREMGNINRLLSDNQHSMTANSWHIHAGHSVHKTSSFSFICDAGSPATSRLSPCRSLSPTPLPLWELRLLTPRAVSTSSAPPNASSLTWEGLDGEKQPSVILYSCPLQPDRMCKPQYPEQQEHDPDEWAETLAARHRLLDHHGASERRHARQVAHTDPEHDQHQGPTTAKAVPSMSYTQVPGWTRALPVVVHEETEWCAAYVQAALLQRTELEQASDEERHRTDQPGMHCQPWPQGHQQMH